MAKKKVYSAVKSNNDSAVIGYFEGKSGDGTVVNENGLEIGTEVWQNIFDSEEYKSHLKNGFYIGFLGHPDDPGCQDFKNACIILREAHIDDNGEVFAKCDLIDTPVGRIVKTFIDAGVHFGLSVRGAGNIIDSKVEPDDFIFRGFDVVAFPAYTDAIPDFVEIAASTRPEDKLKYKKVYASICEEIPEITKVESLEELKGQFDEGSDPYNMIEDRICEIGDDSCSKCENMCHNKCDESFDKCKFEGLMSLYLKSLDTIKDLTAQLEEIQLLVREKERKLQASTRLYKSQMQVMAAKCDSADKDKHKIYDRYKEVVSSNSSLKKENAILASKNEDLNDVIEASRDKVKKAVMSSKKLEAEKLSVISKNKVLSDENSRIEKDLEKVQNKNLNYKCKVNSSEDAINERDSIISSLKTQLNETVKKADISMKKLSNCGDEIKELQSDVDSALSLVAEYQNAYAELYASIVGVPIDGLVVANTTTVSELKDCITGSTSTANIPVNPDFLELTEDEIEESDEFDQYFEDEYLEDEEI